MQPELFFGSVSWGEGPGYFFLDGQCSRSGFNDYARVPSRVVGHLASASVEAWPSGNVYIDPQRPPVPSAGLT